MKMPKLALLIIGALLGSPAIAYDQADCREASEIISRTLTVYPILGVSAVDTALFSIHEDVKTPVVANSAQALLIQYILLEDMDMESMTQELAHELADHFFRICRDDNSYSLSTFEEMD